MNPIPINLAIEDHLSEAVLRRLLKDANRGYAIGTAYGRTGFGYLKKTIAGWNNAARSTPFAVLTDLDTTVCPSELLHNWLPSTQHPNLILRIAVREVESWLLADKQNLSEYLSVHLKWMPDNPDALPDPKQALVQLASRSRSSDIKKRLVPKPGSTAKQGRDHNDCLVLFVNKHWDIHAARTQSPSLRRAMEKFEAFTPTWHCS